MVLTLPRRWRTLLPVLLSCSLQIVRHTSLRFATKNAEITRVSVRNEAKSLAASGALLKPNRLRVAENT